MTACSAGSDTQLRQKIFAAATRLFAERGYSATSIRDLTEACDCTRPSLYYYFDSKEALFRAVVEARLETHEALVRELVDGDGPVKERVQSAISRYVEAAMADPDGMRLLQRVETRPEDSLGIDIMATRRIHLDMLSTMIARGIASGEIREDVAAGDCAMALAGAVSFQCELALADGEWEIERFYRIIDLVFEGLGARETK